MADFVKPKVLSCHETIDAIVAGRLSTSRLGDGEFKIVEGYGTRTQPGTPELTKRMRKVLHSTDHRLMVCLLDVWHDHPVADVWPSRERTVARFGNKEWARRYLPDDRTWGCAAITRLCTWALGDHAEYWAKVRRIWEGRPVFLVSGSKKGRAAVGGLLSNAAKVDVWDLNQKTDCWSRYTEILAGCEGWAAKQAGDPLVYAAIGATATILAQDLCKRGVQCLDAGHMAQAWHRVSPKDVRDEP